MTTKKRGMPLFFYAIKSKKIKKLLDKIVANDYYINVKRSRKRLLYK